MDSRISMMDWNVSLHSVQVMVKQMIVVARQGGGRR